MSQPSIIPSNRIRELSAINADVPALLSSASAALQALTGRPAPTPPASTNKHEDNDLSMADANSDGPADLDSQKEAFTDNATAYFTTLQSIMARLRRQAYALEEAGIIATEAPTLSSTASNEVQRPAPGQGAGIRRGIQVQQKQVIEEERTTNGGLGNLDVGYLNSRGARVGGEKEQELVEEARRILEALVGQKEEENDDGAMKEE